MVRLEHLYSGIINLRKAYINVNSPLERLTHACSSPTPLFVCNTLTVFFGSTVIIMDWTRLSSRSEIMGISTTENECGSHIQ